MPHHRPELPGKAPPADGHGYGRIRAMWRLLLPLFGACFAVGIGLSQWITADSDTAAVLTALNMRSAFGQDPPVSRPPEGPVVAQDRIVYPDGSQTVFYKCQNRAPADLVPVINRLVPGLTLEPYPERLTLIIVKAPADKVDLVTRVLEWIDAPRTQVLIEVKIISLTYDRDFQFGHTMEWDRRQKSEYFDTFFRGFETTFHPADYLRSLASNPTSASAAQDDFQGATFTFRAVDAVRDDLGALDLTIRTLAGTGRVTVLSRPAILCEDGFTAAFFAGDEVPIQTARINNNNVFIDTQFRQVGINLNITPTLVGDGYVTLEAFTEISAVSQFFDPGSGLTNPIITNRRGRTTVNIASGQTLEIGGLRSTRTLLTATGIPLLMDIPILGYLFRSTRREIRRQDIIFWITPTIIPGEGGAAPLSFLRDRLDGDGSSGGNNSDGDGNDNGEGGGEGNSDGDGG